MSDGPWTREEIELAYSSPMDIWAARRHIADRAALASLGPLTGDMLQRLGRPDVTVTDETRVAMANAARRH